MKKLPLILVASTLALAILGTGGRAQATCISSALIVSPDPGAGTSCSITAAATSIDIVFAYAAAADTSVLLNGTTVLIGNTQPVGNEVTLSGLIIGQTLDFTFVNQTVDDDFQPGIVASDGNEHIAVQSSFTDFQSDARNTLTEGDLGPAYGVMTAIAPIADWTFIGMEDLLTDQYGDFDYNDFILGVRGIAAVPEPASLGMFAVALLAFGAMRGRRRGRRARI